MPVKTKIVDPRFDMNLIPHIEVEIPDTCPHCGADLTEAGCTIREAGFVWYSSPAFIDKAAPEYGRTEDAIECDGFEESFDNSTLRTGYLCNACDKPLTP